MVLFLLPLLVLCFKRKLLIWPSYMCCVAVLDHCCSYSLLLFLSSSLPAVCFTNRRFSMSKVHSYTNKVIKRTLMLPFSKILWPALACEKLNLIRTDLTIWISSVLAKISLGPVVTYPITIGVVATIVAFSIVPLFFKWNLSFDHKSSISFAKMPL